MGLSFAIVALFFPLMCMFLWAVISSLMSRRLIRAAWTVPIIAAICAIVVASNVAFDAHWNWIRSDMERASASEVCPSRVGLAFVHDCTKIGGYPAYDLGSGFLDLDYLTKAQDLPTSFEMKQELTDGWRLVIVDF